jgi:hypothetical protein
MCRITRFGKPDKGKQSGSTVSEHGRISRPLAAATPM